MKTPYVKLIELHEHGNWGNIIGYRIGLFYINYHGNLQQSQMGTGPAMPYDNMWDSAEEAWKIYHDSPSATFNPKEPIMRTTELEEINDLGLWRTI